MNRSGQPGIVLCASLCILALLAGARQALGQATITETVSPTFGFVMGGPANRRFVLNTSDTVTGPNAGDYLFGAVSGELVIQRRGGPIQIQIVAENVTTSGGVTANAILCKWHNSPETNCDGPGILESVVGRRRLLLGVDMTTTQLHNGGDKATVSFDVTAWFL
jgi:hypothetical protein